MGASLAVKFTSARDEKESAFLGGFEVSANDGADTPERGGGYPPRTLSFFVAFAADGGVGGRGFG